MAGSSQSLFATRRLLELRIPGGKPGAEGSTALQRYCAKLPPDTVTLVQLPARRLARAEGGMVRSAGRSRRRWSRRAPITRKALPQWLAGRLQSAGAASATRRRSSSSPIASKAICWPPTRKCRSSRFCFRRARSAFDQVREAVLDVARYDVFSSGRGDARRRRAAARAHARGLEGEGVAPPLVLWALTEEIRAIGTRSCRRRGGQARLRRWCAKRASAGSRTRSRWRRDTTRYSVAQVHDALAPCRVHRPHDQRRRERRRVGRAPAARAAFRAPQGCLESAPLS